MCDTHVVAVARAASFAGREKKRGDNVVLSSTLGVFLMVVQARSIDPRDFRLTVHFDKRCVAGKHGLPVEIGVYVKCGEFAR